MSGSVYADFQQYVTDTEASGAFQNWAPGHAADGQAWHSYSRAILAGQAPARPTMTSPFGKSLVDVGAETLDALGLAPTPTPVPNPTPPPSGLIFQDEFDGAAGAPPDPSKWVVKNGMAPFGDMALPSNVFLDGKGNLVVRTARDPKGGYTGGFVDTFGYGSGWPPAHVKVQIPVPFRIETLILMPDTPGAHSSLWMMNVDRSNSQHNYELDIAEERTTLDTTFGSHQHDWVGGKDQHPMDGQLPITSMRKNWHVYRGDVYPDRVETYCDGVLAKTFYGVSGHFGAILSNGIAPAGSWAANGKQPALGDPGPWDMLVNYIRVAAL